MRFFVHRLARIGLLSTLCAVAVVSSLRAATPTDTPTVVTVSGGETIDVGGTKNILIRAPKPHGSILLLTGGDGRLNVMDGARFTDGADNVVIRNRDAFVAKGYDVLLVDLGTNLAAAVDYMARLKRPVTVISTSKGTQRAAEGIAQGARPDKLVLSSGFLSEASGPGDSVMSILGKPERLPPTLLVNHRDDHCRWTNPAGVAPFLAWGGKQVQVTWLSGGKDDEANPCRFSAHHGFAGQDEAFVSHIMGFVSR